jgi:WhiB family redox-sensing transcriptional regulator
VDWVYQARCKDEDPELFFPIGNTGPAAAQIDMAKGVCCKCEVRDECLEWAMSTGQDAGVWGGLSEDERRALRRARRRSELSRLALSTAS